MKSYYNMQILQNLYRLKAIGSRYVQTISYNQPPQEPIANDLQTLTKQIQNCHLCDLNKSRTQSMDGFGSHEADVMVIDSIVSEAQDQSNSYYSGRASQMLKDMVVNVLGLGIEEIFYTHTIKCKPINQQKEYTKEWMSCNSYLRTQIALINPKIIVTLGEMAYRHLMQNNDEFEYVRGHVVDYKGKKLIPIYHPSYILRNPKLKKIVFNDLKTIKSYL